MHASRSSRAAVHSRKRSHAAAQPTPAAETFVERLEPARLEGVGSSTRPPHPAGHAEAKKRPANVSQRMRDAYYGEGTAATAGVDGHRALAPVPPANRSALRASARIAFQCAEVTSSESLTLDEHHELVAVLPAPLECVVRMESQQRHPFGPRRRVVAQTVVGGVTQQVVGVPAARRAKGVRKARRDRRLRRPRPRSRRADLRRAQSGSGDWR